MEKIRYQSNSGVVVEKSGHIDRHGWFFCDGSGPEDALEFLGADGQPDALPWLSQDGTPNIYSRVRRVKTGQIIDLTVTVIAD